MNLKLASGVLDELLQGGFHHRTQGNAVVFGLVGGFAVKHGGCPGCPYTNSKSKVRPALLIYRLRREHRCCRHP